MNRYLYAEEKDNRRTGLWLSILFHIILIFLFLAPCFSHFKNRPPENFQGIVVALGEPENENQTSAKQNISDSPVEKPQSEKKPTSTKSPVKPVKVTEIKSSTTVDMAEQVASEEPSIDEVQQKLEAERLKKEAEAKAKAEAERKRIEEAKQKAEAKEKAKSKFNSMFNTGSDDDSGSKGIEQGQPNASELDKLSSGSAKIGTGLGERNLLHAPTIRDNTQKTGRVIITICVDSSGKVLSARYRQKGSTTTDAHLVSLAENSAKEYRFSESPIKEQCGDIIIDFKLK